MLARVLVRMVRAEFNFDLEGDAVGIVRITVLNEIEIFKASNVGAKAFFVEWDVVGVRVEPFFVKLVNCAMTKATTNITLLIM